MRKDELRLQLAAIDARLARRYAQGFRIERAKAVAAGAKALRGVQSLHMKRARRLAEAAYTCIARAKKLLSKSKTKPQLYLVK